MRKYGVHDAAKALTEMQKSMKRWSDIHGRLKVWARDEDARIEQERIEETMTGVRPHLGRRPLQSL